MTVAVAALAVVVVLLSVVVAGLLRSHATILRKLNELEGTSPSRAGARPSGDGAAGGAAAHDVRGTAPDGTTLALRVAGARHDTVLLFLSTRCVNCGPFWDALADPASPPLPGDVRLVVVTQGPDVEDVDAIRRLAPRDVTVVMSSEAWTDYDVPGSPFVAYVDGPGRTIRGRGSHETWADMVRILRGSGDGTPSRHPAGPRADATAGG